VRGAAVASLPVLSPMTVKIVVLQRGCPSPT